ncbi:hypothetical protein [Kribbella sp. NBC_00889]|uniref:hypothetical protein n=1 Tax=Kribbella sp. NBC_00889 TaxID=2975974 RepID=UPI0038702AB1|nr:hypothetical protein OG817_01405 [Kribbella sp. NBC_00889]
MSIFRRPTDPTEVVLRRLSKSLRWFRPSLADAPTPYSQLGHLAQHRLCPAIEQGDAAPVMTALAITEAALAGADLDHVPDANLDEALTLGLVEVVSNWCSWPETPPEVVATIEAGMGPMTCGRWNSVRDQGNTVADWIRNGGAADRTGETPAAYREIENADLRFLTRSDRQYIDETTAVGTADRLRFEMATGQGV